MEALALFPKTLQTSVKILFTNFGNTPAAVAYQYVNKLRNQGISCELYPTEAKLKKQLAYANDKKIPKVVLIGSEELAKKEFVLKDMNTGDQTPHGLEKLMDLLS